MNNINHFEQSLAQTLWLPSSFKRTLIGGKSVAFLVKIVLKLWPHFFTKCPKNSKMKALNDFLNGIKLLLVSSDLSRTQLHKWERSYRLFPFGQLNFVKVQPMRYSSTSVFTARDLARPFFARCFLFASRSTE